MLRILDYPWHQAHTYRLHKLPAMFHFLDIRPLTWNTMQRPIPSNFAGLVDPKAVEPGVFSVCLLHLDQWCTTMLNMRAMPFRLSRIIAERAGIPAVVIMHGTPDTEIYTDNRAEILQLLGDLPVVCNSRAAAEEWDGGDGRLDRHGLPQFRYIIHGYDTSEFWSSSLSRRKAGEVVSICSGGTISRWYHGLALLDRIKRDVAMAVYGPSGNREWLTDYHAYRLMLSRVLIYFSPTRRAPMPGARTEAMLSGACIVTVPGNDIEYFVEHGQTGFIVPTYEEAVKTLRALLANPQWAWEVGQAGREAARSYFGHERFVEDWLHVLGGLNIGGKRDDEVDSCLRDSGAAAGAAQQLYSGSGG